MKPELHNLSTALKRNICLRVHPYIHVMFHQLISHTYITVFRHLLQDDRNFMTEPLSGNIYWALQCLDSESRYRCL